MRISGLGGKIIDKAKDDVRKILDARTITQARAMLKKELEVDAVEEVEYPKKDFFLTEKRKNVLREITKEIENGEELILLQGDYGTGKSSFCEFLTLLCESGQELEDEFFSRLKYEKEKELLPIHIRTTDNLQGREFIETILDGLERSGSEEFVVEAYNNLAVEDSDKIDSRAGNLLRKAEDIKDITDSLDNDLERIKEKDESSKPSAYRVKVLEYLLDKFYEEFNIIPMLIIDEFEKAVREGTETLFLERNFLRNRYEHADLNYLITCSAVRVNDIKNDLRTSIEDKDTELEEIDIEMGFLDRFPSAHIIDPNPSEARELMKKIYRFYTIPILEAYKKENEDSEEVVKWLENLKKDKSSIYPISEYVQDILTKRVLKQRKETEKISNFRSYKKLIKHLIELWNPRDGEIDKQNFTKFSDKLREIAEDRSILGINLERIPSKKLIKEKLEQNLEVLRDEKYNQYEIIEKSVIYLMFKSEPTGDRYSLTRSEINEEFFEREVKKAEFQSLLEFIDNRDIDFFNADIKGEILNLNIDDLLTDIRDVSRLGEVIVSIFDGSESKYKIDGKSLENINILELWKLIYEDSDSDANLNEDKDELVVHTSGNSNYLTNLYITKSEEVYQNRIKSEDFENSKGLNLAIRLEETEDEPFLNLIVKCSSKGGIDEKFAEVYRNRFEEAVDLNEELLNELERNWGKKKKRTKLLKLLLAKKKIDLKKWVNYSIKFEIEKMSDFNAKRLGDKWAIKKIGFDYHNYGLKELCNFICALKIADEKGLSNILYENPYFSDIDFVKSSHGRKNQSSEDFNEWIRDNMLDKEEFLESMNEQEIKISNEFNNRWKENRKIVRKTLNGLEKGSSVSFEKIKSKLFARDPPGKVRYHLYCFLVLEEYRDNNEIVLVGEDEADNVSDIKIEDADEHGKGKKNRLESQLDEWTKQELIRFAWGEGSEEKLKNALDRYEELKEGRRGVDDIKSEVFEMDWEKPEAAGLNFDFIDNISESKSASIIKGLKGIAEKDTIPGVLLSHILKDLLEDLEFEITHSNLKRDISKLIADVNIAEINHDISACDVEGGIERRISDEFSEKGWYKEDPQEISDRIENNLKDEVDVALTRFKNGDIDGAVEKIEGISEAFTIEYESELDDAHLKKDQKKREVLANLIDTKMSEILDFVGDKEKKIVKWRDQPIFSLFDGKLERIKNTELENLSNNIEKYKNNMVEEDIQNLVLDLKESVESELNEVHKKVIENNKDPIEEKISKTSLDDDLVSRVSKESYSNSIDDHVDDINYEDIEKMVDAVGADNDLILSILQCKVFRGLER